VLITPFIIESCHLRFQPAYRSNPQKGAVIITHTHGNESPPGRLPRLFNRDNVDQRHLAEFLDLMNLGQFSTAQPGARDLLGEVYKYVLAKLASAEDAEQ